MTRWYGETILVAQHTYNDHPRCFIWRGTTYVLLLFSPPGISKTAGGSLYLKKVLTRLRPWRIKKATATTTGSIVRPDSCANSISTPPPIGGSWTGSVTDC